MSEFGDVFTGDCATEIATMIRQEAADCGSPADYVAYLAGSYARRQLADPFFAAATWVEPVDRDMPGDPELSTGTAFMRGSILGLRVVEHYLGENNIFRILTDTKLAEPVVEDDEEGYKMKHMRGVLLCDIGEKGYALAETYGEIIEEWEDSITPDVRYQPYLRRGFGLVMSLMNQILEADATAAHATEMEEFAADLDTLGEDWDSAFEREILGHID